MGFGYGVGAEVNLNQKDIMRGKMLCSRKEEGRIKTDENVKLSQEW